MVHAVRLRGRLGNHLFQYALGRALSPGEPVVVEDLLRSPAALEATLRPGSVRVTTNAEALRLRQPPRLPRGRVHLGRRVAALPDGALKRWLQEYEYHEQVEAHFDPAVFERPAPTLFCGYFQHERYFADIADIADLVAGAIRPPTSVATAGLEAFDLRTGSVPSVAVVVRAGLDYEKLEWIQRYSWYRQAAERLVGAVPRARFAVFSDVPLAAEATAAALRDLGPSEAVVRLDATSQLQLIAAMDHAIVSASTFAWWGAWLGDHARGFATDRVVIAPDPWIRPELAATPSHRWLREPQ